jgi:hypothetical protein
MMQRQVFRIAILWALLLTNSLYLPAQAQSVLLSSDSLCRGNDRFSLDSATTKLVDNKGIGPDSLWGVRNFRVVLHNILYRGGGNNLDLKEKDPHHYIQNPLPLAGIRNLFQVGFTKAIYLYEANFDLKYPPGRIDSLRSAGFAYSSQLDIVDVNLRSFFLDIRKRAEHPEMGAVYIHCWNGWHQSGLLSALTLIQFCGLSNQQALNYWTLCTDGHTDPYTKLKARIMDFKPFPDIGFTDEQKKEYCPCFNESILNDTLMRVPQLSDKDNNNGQRSAGEYHIVAKGETLYGIARKYGIPLSTLLSLNKMRSTDVIYPGQKIRVK